MNENGVITSSPGWGSILEKSIVRTSTRAGVPVLNRLRQNPSSVSAPDSGPAGKSPCGPACHVASPMIMRLLRYTPVHSTAARQS